MNDSNRSAEQPPPAAPLQARDGRPVLRSSEHTVQFYHSDGFLCRTANDFLLEGLSTGGHAVFIGTRAHADALRAALDEAGVKAGAGPSWQRIALLDAEDTLDRFMVNDTPDARLFDLHVGSLIAERTAASRVRLRAFGEMVDLLWSDGLQKAALELERLWNGLARQHSFSLLCGYSMTRFGTTDDESLREICRAHSHVAPAETTSAEPEAGAEIVRAGVLAERTDALKSRIAKLRRELQDLDVDVAKNRPPTPNKP